MEMYYVQRANGGKVFGPWGPSHIEKLIGSGKMGARDKVSTDKSSWVAVELVKRFRGLFDKTGEEAGETAYELKSEHVAAPPATAPPATAATTGRPKPNHGLLDIGFNRYATPVIVKVAWVASLIIVWGSFLVACAYMAYLTVNQYAFDAGEGALAAIASIILAAGFAVVAALLSLWIRVSLELCVVVFNISETLNRIELQDK